MYAIRNVWLGCDEAHNIRHKDRDRNREEAVMVMVYDIAFSKFDLLHSFHYEFICAVPSAASQLLKQANLWELKASNYHYDHHHE